MRGNHVDVVAVAMDHVVGVIRVIWAMGGAVIGRDGQQDRVIGLLVTCPLDLAFGGDAGQCSPVRTAFLRR